MSFDAFAWWRSSSAAIRRSMSVVSTGKIPLHRAAMSSPTVPPQCDAHDTWRRGRGQHLAVYPEIRHSERSECSQSSTWTRAAVWTACALTLLAGCGGSAAKRPASATTLSPQTSAPAVSTTTATARSVTLSEIPPSLKNLWSGNVQPGDRIDVIDTTAGPVYVVKARGLEFGTCAATALVPNDGRSAVVCNP